MAVVKKRGRPRKDKAATVSVERRILDTACQLFYEEGLHAVGIDRLLVEAGAAKASLYSHYASKDELVAAYLDALGRGWRARVEERLAPKDGRAGLRALFELVEEWVRSKTFRGCPFLNAVSELPDPAHPAREAVRRHREWLHGLIRGLVASAGNRDVARVTRAIVVLYDGAIASAAQDGDPGAVAAASHAASRLLDEQSR